MNRDSLIERLADETYLWDFIVVGGGATGLGVGVEAASRGYSVLLLEQDDFAKATSSRSTKLVHGGVRYLQQGNISLVLEALHERGRLLQNAPHLVFDQAFVVPTYDWWGGPFYGIGLKLYDMLAGKLGFGPSRLLSREETLERIPTVETGGLVGGVIYHDGQFDDSRLSVTLARTIDDLGGTPLNYVRVTGLTKARGFVNGVEAEDLETGTTYTLQARAVINATGIFTDEVRRMDDASITPVMVASQGVHIVLDRSFLPGDSAIMVPKTDDGRVLFAVPWHERVVVGTTDTPIDGPSLEPAPLEEEIDFLIEHAARYLSKDPTREDVLSVFAGIRPLVAEGGADGDTSKLARDHVLMISPSGLVTITGGKWTTYRKMAEDTVDKALDVAGVEPRPSETEQLRLHGWIKHAEADGLLALYGSDLPAVRRVLDEVPDGHELLHEALPYHRGEVVYAVRHEMARTVEDVLSRRTRSLLLDAAAAIESAPTTAALMAGELGRDEAWQHEQVETFRELARQYLLADTERARAVLA